MSAGPATVYVDIETIQREGVPRPVPTPEKPDPFGSAPTHEPVVTVMVAQVDGAWKRRVVMRGERCVLQARSTIVTWNGRSFDLPVLMWDSLIRGDTANANALRVLAAEYRYKPERNLDLMDWLTCFGAAPRVSLDAAAKAIGLRGKGDVDGTQVADLWAAGERERLVTYCTEDVVMLALLHLRWTGDKVAAADLWTAASEWTPELIAGSDRSRVVDAIGAGA